MRKTSFFAVQAVQKVLSSLHIRRHRNVTWPPSTRQRKRITPTPRLPTSVSCMEVIQVLSSAHKPGCSGNNFISIRCWVLWTIIDNDREIFGNLKFIWLERQGQRGAFWWTNWEDWIRRFILAFGWGQKEQGNLRTDSRSQDLPDACNLKPPGKFQDMLN